MQITINSVNDLNYGSETYVKFSLKNGKVTIESSYGEDKPSEVLALLKMIDGPDMQAELKDTLNRCIAYKNEEKATEFSNLAIALSEEGKEKKIAWHHIDIQDLLDQEMESIQEEMDLEEVDIIKPIINDSEVFEQWLADTNFDIRPYLSILENIDGVVAITYFNRYRFVVTIGKLFSFKQIRREITEKLGINA